MAQQSENVVTQEDLIFSPPGSPTASGDEGESGTQFVDSNGETGTQFFDSNGETGTQFFDSNQDVEMSQIQHANRQPLFLPDPDSSLHDVNHASGSQFRPDQHASALFRPASKRPSDTEYATDTMKRIKLAPSQNVRRANHLLVEQTERQKRVLKDQETRLVETVGQQQVILQEFRDMQQQIAQERDNFQQRLAEAEREKASREADLLREIQAIKAAKEAEVAAIKAAKDVEVAAMEQSQVGNPEQSPPQDRDASMHIAETNHSGEGTSDNSEPSTSRRPPVQVDINRQVGGSTGNSLPNPTGASWQKINAKVKAKRGKSRMILGYHEYESEEEDEEEEDEEGDGNQSGDDGEGKGKGENPFESKEAFERMMKKVVGNALLEFQCRKRGRTQRGNEERAARKKNAEKEKIEEDKWMRNQFCALIREVFSEKFGVTTDEDYALHQTPLRGVVKLYNTNQGPGPDRENLQIDMRSKISQPWNQDVAEILLEEVLKKLDDEKWSFLPERSESYFMELIESKMERAKSYWTNAQPKYKEDGGKETIDETETRLVTWKEKREKIGRADARRHNRYERRMKTLDRAVELKQEENAPDLEAWVWSRSVVKTLGEDGMSSDESDVDDEGVTIFRPKIMPWRPDVERLMRNIDKQSMIDKDLFSQKGAKPGYRCRAFTRAFSRRDPPTGRPKPFYDKEWLKTLSEKKKRKLMISKEKFRWMKLNE